MIQVPARHYYWRLEPGTKGMFYWPGRKPTPVVLVTAADMVNVVIEGAGVRRNWHVGLHEGLLQSAFSWEIEDASEPEEE